MSQHQGNTTVKTSEFLYPDKLLDRLQKGSVILRKTIEPLLPPFSDEREYQLLVLQWRTGLEARLKDRGLPCTTRSRGYGESVVILTDAEASDFNCRAARSYLRRFSRRGTKLNDVDVSNLDNDERKRHESAIRSQAMYQASIDDVSRTLRPRPARRNIPALLQAEEE